MGWTCIKERLPKSIWPREVQTSNENVGKTKKKIIERHVQIVYHPTVVPIETNWQKYNYEKIVQFLPTKRLPELTC